MGIVAVLEIIGKGIEELIQEKEALEHERNGLRESCDFAFRRLREVEKERDELKAKVQAFQDYADSLAAKCENVSKEEKLLALSFTGDVEIEGKTEEIKESGC